MKICLIGKYPPIEGGVSTNTYWLARGLAARGHEVHVVTNADEVEEFYKLSLSPDDAAFYQPEFTGGGCVRVYNPQPYSRHAMGHIPQANPFVSKLASLATDVTRRHGCEVILAYYYEPYGVAGWLASRWTQRPLILKHAGSDLDRLFRVGDLATTYREILQSADAVVTQPFLMSRFAGMGVAVGRLEADIPYSVPTEFFNSAARPLDMSASAASLDTGGVDDGAPVIGLYGKIGVSKGTFDLVAALGELARKGVKFKLAAMVGEAQGQHLISSIQRAHIEDRTLVLPMLPNWKVPSFLRACTAACFLERDFPVAIHGPIVPREILACGTCLVVSEEIASKQRYSDRLRPGENALVVADPRDLAKLAGTLGDIVANPALARAIGQEGLLLSRSLERHEEFISGWEGLLERLAYRAVARPSAEKPKQEAAPKTKDFTWLLPDLFAFLQRRAAPRVDGFSCSGAAEDVFQTALAFCDYMMEHIDRHVLADELPKLRTVLAYAKERLAIAYNITEQGATSFAVSDYLVGGRVTPDSASQLVPVRGENVVVRRFEYDVAELGVLSSVGGYQATGEDEIDFAKMLPNPTLVLFSRLPNLIPLVLRIDEATRNLVERCDGSVTTADLVNDMCSFFAADTESACVELTQQVHLALDHLYRTGVIVFGKYADGWGWAGGERSSWLAGRSPVDVSNHLRGQFAVG